MPSLVGFTAGWPAVVLAQEQRYEVTPIGHLPGSFATVPLAMNNLGEVVGWCQGPQAQLRPFRFIPGTGITEVPLPPGFTEGFATDITDNGIIVGRATTGINTPAVLWRLRDGEHTIIGPTGQNCSSPIADGVNSAGDVVGIACGTGPFYYSDATGLVELEQFGIRDASDINDAGVVTGRSNAGPALRWSIGGPLELIGTLPDDDYAIGQAINESGQVAGLSADALTGPDSWDAFLYSDAAGLLAIDPTIAFRSAGSGINERGHVCGNRGTSSTPDRDPWVWTPERGVELLTAEFIGDPNFWGFSGAADINDRGQITLRGAQFEPFDPAPGIILTPIVECAADFDDSGNVTSADITAFLSAWFADISGGTLAADFDASGSTTSADITAFLGAWFAAITGNC
ncbi:MAG: hypothetical protein H7Y88_00505 [Phycisphaerales bacterium]|nr:hypothetical protein [Phycisphaerales bacterium]